MQVYVQIHLTVTCVRTAIQAIEIHSLSAHSHSKMLCFQKGLHSLSSENKPYRCFSSKSDKDVFFGPQAFTSDWVDSHPGVYAPHLACGVLVNVQTQLAWNAHSFCSPDYRNNGW